MEIIRTNDFERALQKLPKEIQRLYARQEKRFRQNWRDPRLHVKAVRMIPGSLSFRVTRRYRAFFYFQNAENAIIFDIDHRKDVYRN